MQTTRPSFKAFLRGSVAALAALPMITNAALATATFHGEKQVNTMAAPPTNIVVTRVKTPAGINDNHTTTPIKHVIIIVGEYPVGFGGLTSQVEYVKPS